MEDKYSAAEQELETITVEEDNNNFDQTLAKILLVGLITTSLFFLRS